jgi:N-methylhydantoinase A
MAFGGGGPLHAVDVARALDIRQLLITPASGVFSAAGMLTADIEHDVVRPVLAPLEFVSTSEVETMLAALRDDGLRALAAEGYRLPDTALRFAADLRYLGQSSDLTIALPKLPFGAGGRQALAAAFHEAYRATYGYQAEEAIELVNLRLTAVGLAAGRLDFAALHLDPSAVAGTAGTRPISLPDGTTVVARLLARDQLVPGETTEGPAIIESYDTTILIPPGYAARAIAAGAVAIAPIEGHN